MTLYDECEEIWANNINHFYLVITKRIADHLFPDGWTEESLKEKGFTLNKPIEEMR